jgi:hypothetical protein
MFGFDRITFDPDVMGGRACIRGMRIAVSLIVNLVANGMTVALCSLGHSGDRLRSRRGDGVKFLADMGRERVVYRRRSPCLKK